MSVMRGLEVTSEETRFLHDAIVDRFLAQREHVCAQEEPSERAYEILDMLQELKSRLSDLVYPQRYSRF